MKWGGIEIINWAHYQSKSYLRVKKHREKKRLALKEEEEKRRRREEEERACNAPVTSRNDSVTKIESEYDKLKASGEL